jgi:hypothetical protein
LCNSSLQTKIDRELKEKVINNILQKLIASKTNKTEEILKQKEDITTNRQFSCR